ncbi:beta subunit of fatty acid synthetase [Entomophthora muscae]|uniref:Beta subunit of fatty acid synthetase n=1 Tax=Entomophthora muscae TaxID=34485 RepID=A0ACC2UK03_9FUNG|nr:beta subunit of fatty acid synthetase [Entomophthora muscae]
MLAIYNLQLGEVKQLFKIINHHLSQEHYIFIELLNYPHSTNDVSPVTQMIAISPVGTSGISSLTYLIKWQPILNFRKDYFIKQFNGDSQKPWDRCKSDESTFDLLEMTYVDVVNRLIEAAKTTSKIFYYQLWFNSDEFNEFSIDPHHTLVAEAVANHVKVYVEHIWATTLALIDFIIIVAWMSIIKAIFSKFIDGDPLKLVNLSKIFTMVKSSSPMYSVNSESVDINMMEVDSQFFYSVIFTVLKTAFHNSS